MHHLDPVLAERLLREVLRSPHADEPRLVYADWLTEGGDPRGAFIHAQCRLASFDEVEPEWCALFAQSERALFRHGPGWAAPLAELLGARPGPGDLVFRRGFVEHVGARLQSPRQLEALAQRTPLRSMLLCQGAEDEAFVALVGQLALRELVVESLPRHGSYRGWSRQPGLALLEALDLSEVESLSIQSDFTPEEMRPLASLLDRAQLRSLTLSRVGLTSAGAGTLARGGGLSRLERLDLSHNDLGIRGLRPIVAALGPQAVRLLLQGNEKLWGHVHEALAGRPWRALQLEELVTDDLFAMLGPMEDLRELRLGVVRDEQAQRLELPRLTRLEIGGAYRSPLSVDAWRAVCDHPHLVELSARGTRVGDEGVEVLVRSPLTRLTRLDLSNVRLTERGIWALAAWPGLAHLVELDLSSNAIGTDGVQALLSSALDPTRLVLDDASSRASWPALQERFGRAVADRPYAGAR